MFHSEMRLSSSKRYHSNQSFRFILVLLIIVTYGESLPHHHSETKRFRGDLRRRSLYDNSADGFQKDTKTINEIPAKVTGYHDTQVKKNKKNELISEIAYDAPNELSERQSSNSFKRTRSRRSSASHIFNPGAKPRHNDMRNKNLVSSDSEAYRRKESSQQDRNVEHQSNSHDMSKNLPDEDADEDVDEDDTTDEPRIDLILNDMSPQKFSGFENIMDYYYVSEADEHNQFGVPKHGVIINLRGLIPSRVDIDDDALQEGLSRDEELNDEKKSDAVLAFKAFEISSSPLSVDPGRSLSEFDDQYNEEATDVKSHNTTSLESRNLSRKRRQKASPNQENVPDRHRRGNFRRRRRKRKRRLRPSKISDVIDGKSRSDDKFLLRSNGPAYVITSANEVKKDWCRTVPLKQRITEANCRPRVIMNNFCYGQCNSFFIPHSGKSDSSAAFQSCAFCKPHKSKWTTVTLHCPGQTPSKIEKKILMVEACRCKTEILN